MALRWIGWVCSIGLGSAFPLHTRQTTTSNSHSAKIIAPVVIVAVVAGMLLAIGWWKRRKRTQELIQQLQTPAANNNNTSTNNATTQTTPSTGPDAPARPPRRRRRRRRRPSQISTKSLPAYNQEAGDEEIVLVRPAPRQDGSDDEDEAENDNNNRADRPVTATNATDSRPLLDEDSSPDMPRVSLASSTRGRSPNEHPEQDQAQSQLGHESIAPTMTVGSSIADTEPEPELAPAAALHPHGEVPSYTEAMSTSHVNLPSEIEHTPQPSTTDTDPAVPADPNATVRPKRKSVFRHLGRLTHIAKPSGSTPSESVEMTAPRPSTSSHRPSGSVSTHRPSTSLSVNQHRPSPSLSSLSLILTRSQSPTMSRTSLNISAPIQTTLVRTELSYPRAGPTPEQIRFLSSRESLGRFGMPYGQEAIAAAKSRDHLPPLYQPRSPTASGSGLPASGGLDGATEEEPTVTIRRGPILLTPGELARQSENAAGSGRAEPDDRHRPDASDPPLDPTMIISEEPKSVNEEPEAEEDTKSIQDQALNGRESRAQPADTREHDTGDIQVEPRARESPSVDDRPKDTRRESVLTTHSFVTATEGDSSPPTPTAETYQPQPPARGQTVLIPESREALHPELTLVPATPIG